jgi:hypothetical protein
MKAILALFVVKPLPQTVIGRTCLKTYPPEAARVYPTTRFYEANLFGIPLRVETLAYQEQDSVAAACATSALWSAFHGTGKLFQHTIPSPIEITKSATQNFLAEMRSLPNKGLTLEQMAHAVKNIGLEPFKIGVSNLEWLKASASGYMRAGVPVILAGHLADTSVTPSEHMGGHAVAITGYRTDDNGLKPWPGTSFHLKSAKISKLYVHDDQIDFDGKNVSINNVTYSSMWSSWKGKNGRGKIGDGRIIPEAVLIPLYNKIRIPYEVIFHTIFDFDGYISMQGSKNLLPINDILEWDIFLSQINDFKDEVFNSPFISENLRIEILTEKMPRYIWRAQASVNNAKVIELLFDATDIEQGNMLFKVLNLHDDLYSYLIGLSKDDAYKSSILGNPSYAIFDWLSKQDIP